MYIIMDEKNKNIIQFGFGKPYFACMQGKVLECMQFNIKLVKGKLNMKFPLIRTNEKPSQGEAKPRRNLNVEKVRRDKIREGESQKKGDAAARKGVRTNPLPTTFGS